MDSKIRNSKEYKQARKNAKKFDTSKHFIRTASGRTGFSVDPDKGVSVAVEEKETGFVWAVYPTFAELRAKGQIVQIITF